MTKKEPTTEERDEAAMAGKQERMAARTAELVRLENAEKSEE
jgi:hypothetical protein